MPYPMEDHEAELMEQIALLQKTLEATRRERDAAESKIPVWRPRGDDESLDLEDGDQLLVAVPCVSDDGVKRTYYEYAVVTLHCDESYSSLTFNGESWGWDWEDVECFIPLKRNEIGFASR